MIFLTKMLFDNCSTPVEGPINSQIAPVGPNNTTKDNRPLAFEQVNFSFKDKTKQYFSRILHDNQYLSMKSIVVCVSVIVVIIIAQLCGISSFIRNSLDATYIDHPYKLHIISILILSVFLILAICKRFFNLKFLTFSLVIIAFVSLFYLKILITTMIEFQNWKALLMDRDTILKTQEILRLVCSGNFSYLYVEIACICIALFAFCALLIFNNKYHLIIACVIGLLLGFKKGIKPLYFIALFSLCFFLNQIGFILILFFLFLIVFGFLTNDIFENDKFKAIQNFFTNASQLTKTKTKKITIDE